MATKTEIQAMDGTVKQDDSNGSSSTTGAHSRVSVKSSATAPARVSTAATTTIATATATTDEPSTPWIIGSTDASARRNSTPLMKPTIPNGLVDQAGVRQATPSPSPPRESSPSLAAAAAAAEVTNLHTLSSASSSSSLLLSRKKQYQERLTHPPQHSTAVESVLGASCETMGFDIAEIWLRTGPKAHQLTNSYLRATALEDSVRKELIDVYYGEKSSDRTHRLSPALCKRAKETNDVVWISAHNPVGAEALRISINNVRTAVAIPVCHGASTTNLTVIYFSIRRVMMKPQAIEFLVHMSLAAAVASVNNLADTPKPSTEAQSPALRRRSYLRSNSKKLSTSEHAASDGGSRATTPTKKMDLQWKDLKNVEYLTDGGTSWIHTALLNGRPVVVKTLKPECQDVVLAINEIESELSIHAQLSHTHIVELVGAGVTSKGVRFLVLERLDGGTLSQRFGYDTRIRDRRRRFWRKKSMTYMDVLKYAKAVASAMAYCQETALEGSIVMHRDLKPDNIGFTLNGTVKILDFGLAKILENSSVKSNSVFEMSGETGSLRYMAPEVASSLPYNHKADVYSFGMILWEMNAGKKPFEGLNRNDFYRRVVDGRERPQVGKKWPEGLCNLITSCWDSDITKRPAFGEVVKSLELLMKEEKGGGVQKRKSIQRISGIIDRHSTWF